VSLWECPDWFSAVGSWGAASLLSGFICIQLQLVLLAQKRKLDTKNWLEPMG
jgi:hypothetical protein